MNSNVMFQTPMKPFHVEQVELNYDMSTTNRKVNFGAPAIEEALNRLHAQGYVLDRIHSYDMGHDPGYNAQVRAILMFRHTSVPSTIL